MRHFKLGQQHVNHLGNRTQASVRAPGGRQADRQQLFYLACFLQSGPHLVLRQLNQGVCWTTEVIHYRTRKVDLTYCPGLTLHEVLLQAHIHPEGLALIQAYTVHIPHKCL